MELLFWKLSVCLDLRSMDNSDTFYASYAREVTVCFQSGSLGLNEESRALSTMGISWTFWTLFREVLVSKTARLVDLMQVTNCNLSSPPVSLSELNDSVNENSDTVGQIVHYIMKNEGMVVSVSRTIQYW